MDDTDNRVPLSDLQALSRVIELFLQAEEQPLSVALWLNDKATDMIKQRQTTGH